MLRLSYIPGTCALATHVALEEADAPYEAIAVDFQLQAQRSPEYLAINPEGRVPALVAESSTTPCASLPRSPSVQRVPRIH